MAALANTQLTTMSVGNREELSNVVDRITPEDTPIYTLIAKESAKSVHPEWEVEELSPPAANRHTEGDEYTFDAIKPPERYGDYTQIMRKSFVISNTQETVDEAGPIQKTKHQKLVKGIEIRKDVEFGILSPQPSIAGANRQFGGLPTWYETNVSRGAGGANGGFDVNTGLTVAPTNGTQRAFTKTLLDDVMEQGYNAGANFSIVSVSPYVKSVFVTFMSDTNVANFRYAVNNGNENSIISNADWYEGPFGKVLIKPNRVQAANATLARNAHLIDKSKLSFKWLRRIAEDKDLAKTGDGKKTVIIGEGTLAPKNEAGLGVIADLIGLRP